jgi:hypothetical protein
VSISSLSSLTAALTSSITPAAGNTVKNSAAANSAAGAAPTASGSGVTNYDFTNITPAQLGSDTQKLVQSGQLSLSQAALLRISSEPLALVGPQGQIVPFTAAQKATLDNTPINALQMVNNQISALQQTGEANNPASNYKEWTGILSTLQSLQGTPESVNTVA